MGSGSLSAMAILETEYKDGMTEEEVTALVTKAIEGGIYHDLGSGSNVDVQIITKDGIKRTRGVKSDNHKIYSNPAGYSFPKGTTPIFEEKRLKLAISDGPAPMEL